MTLLALGISHTTAPVSIREQLSFPDSGLKSALLELFRVPQVDEAAILSTCNRTELYCNIQSDHQVVVDWIADHQQLKQQQLLPYLYFHSDRQSIRHIFRVASGLDSMILGEPQILGQLKSAYHAACEAGTLGRELGKLFQHSFSAAKKVRTDTAIGSSPVSVAFAAVRLARQIFDDLRDQTVLLIGAGETIELTARHFHQQKIGRIIIANRTLERAHALAAQFDGYAIALSELPQHLAEADIVVSSTASQLPILGKGRVESAIKARRHKPMFMVDLAVPRDIESEVSQLNDVYLYTVDDLHQSIEESLSTRREAAEQAEEIIDTEVEHFLAWRRAQGVGPAIRAFRQQAEQSRDVLLQKALQSLDNGRPAEQALTMLANTLTNKLLHTPSAQMRQAGIDEQHDLIAAACELFKLKPGRE